ncbi:hypothetical protein J2752_000151 [Halarchaeum rubridurum]|uniref:Uncharacterized protein n=1 Tax=Halarchaeum rubridurum TaxID=489911 RepID=A0A830FVZ4_9EURY|nr:hypothetical protein [Halarchaeum rubridurum]MBP1953270.1 hypothetical protein [Halarchaeum rubridurum]GGM66575.1 hypothetical protein GCM10009017_15840 [Halarchaeum rubridurum]
MSLLSLAVDFVPKVGLGCLALGSFLLTASVLGNPNSPVGALRPGVGRSISGVQAALSAGAGLGIALSVLHLERTHPLLLIVFAGLPATYIEGFAAPVVYDKLRYAVRNRTLSLPGLGLATKLAVKLAMLFVFLFGVSALTALVSTGTLSLPLGEVAIASWTLFVLLYTAVGLALKFVTTDTRYSTAFVAGTIALLTGAELYNLATLRAELLVMALGLAAYSLGFWQNALRLIRTSRGR